MKNTYPVKMNLVNFAQNLVVKCPIFKALIQSMICLRGILVLSAIDSIHYVGIHYISTQQ